MLTATFLCARPTIAEICTIGVQVDKLDRLYARDSLRFSRATCPQGLLSHAFVRQITWHRKYKTDVAGDRRHVQPNRSGR